VGGGHAAGHIGPWHVGIGMIDRATVRVQWPDGSWSTDYRFNANQHIVITKGDDVATYRALVGARGAHCSPPPDRFTIRQKLVSRSSGARCPAAPLPLEGRGWGWGSITGTALFATCPAVPSP
jgi:hypothetical protein